VLSLKPKICPTPITEQQNQSYGITASTNCAYSESTQSFSAGIGNIFTITGRMNCALSLAGRKIN